MTKHPAALSARPRVCGDWVAAGRHSTRGGTELAGAAGRIITELSEVERRETGTDRDHAPLWSGLGSYFCFLGTHGFFAREGCDREVTQRHRTAQVTEENPTTTTFQTTLFSTLLRSQ